MTRLTPLIVCLVLVTATIVCLVLVDASMRSSTLPASDDGPIIHVMPKEVKFEGKLVRVGMGYEAVRDLLGKPMITEVSVLDSQPAIRAIYYCGSYYHFYFIKDNQGKTTLSHIHIDAGF